MDTLTPDQYAEATITELLDAASHGRIGVDQALLRSILSRGEGTAEEIAEFFLNVEEGWRVDLSADIFHMLRALRSPSAIPVYAELLVYDVEEDPGPIYDALAELGAAAIEPLLKQHQKAGPESQGQIEFLLAGLRVKDDRIGELLKKRLESDPAEGAINLSLYGDTGMRPVLEAKLATELTEHEKHEVQFAIDQLSAETFNDEPEPFDIMALYPETAPPVFDALEPDEMVAFLDHDDAKVRRMAAESLANEELNEDEIKRLLHTAEEDSDVGVRSQAWQALATGLDDEDIVRRIRARCFDTEAPAVERAGAACALAEQELDADLAELLRELYEQPETRALAMKAMWHSFDQQFAEVFPKHLEDLDEDILRNAIWGCGYLGIGHVAGQLEKLFENENVREHALFAYALSAPVELSRGRAKGFFKRIFDLADGLSEAETSVVEAGIDQRLGLHGMEPVFAKTGHRH
jgi:hypothetical protein